VFILYLAAVVTRIVLNKPVRSSYLHT